MSQKITKDSDTLYQTVASSVFQAETVRWTRLNNFLLLESILAVAWWAAMASDELKSQPWLLSSICILGICFGIQWAGLGYRSSKFVDMFHALAESFEIDRGPFKSSRKLRKVHFRIFKSTFILVEVPMLFVLLFSALIWVSWDSQPASSLVIIEEGDNNMEMAVQWAQLIGTGALILTLVAVIWYTVKTSAMAKATKALAEAESRGTEFRERPIVRFVVGPKVPITEENKKTGNITIKNMDPFCFQTHIDNIGNTHAKVRVKASVIYNKKLLKLPQKSLYQGKSNLDMQAGTGIDGHLDFPKLFKINDIEVKTVNQAGDLLTNCEGRELMVRLESWVIYYYNPDSDFDSEFSKNPPAFYRWKGPFAINSYGSWIPEYDVDDFAGL